MTTRILGFLINTSKKCFHTCSMSCFKSLSTRQLLRSLTHLLVTNLLGKPNEWELLFSERLKERRFVVLENKRRSFGISVYPIDALNPYLKERCSSSDPMQLTMYGSSNKSHDAFKIALSIYQATSLDELLKKLHTIILKQTHEAGGAINTLQLLIMNYCAMCIESNSLRPLIRLALETKTAINHAIKVKLFDIIKAISKHYKCYTMLYDYELLSLLITCLYEEKSIIKQKASEVLYMLTNFSKSVEGSEQRQIYLNSGCICILAYLSQTAPHLVIEKLRNSVQISLVNQQKEVAKANYPYKEGNTAVWKYLFHNIGFERMLSTMEKEVSYLQTKQCPRIELSPSSPCPANSIKRILYTGSHKNRDILTHPKQSQNKSADKHIAVCTTHKAKYRNMDRIHRAISIDDVFSTNQTGSASIGNIRNISQYKNILGIRKHPTYQGYYMSSQPLKDYS